MSGTKRAAVAAITLAGAAAVAVGTAPAAFAGDADSSGNRSSTDHSQSLTVTPDSDPTIASLNGGEANAGGGAANAGVNRATGNSGENTSDTENDDQINSDSAANESEGSVANTSGNAHASGNESTAKLRQGATSSGTGGGTTLIGQSAWILSAGGAYADTGFNDGDDTHSGDAWGLGNKSDSTVDQWATVEDDDGALRLVDQDAALLNLGLAIAETGFNVGDTITTGNATALGDEATTGIDQDADVTESPSGPAIVDQDANTANAGAGVANTGLNETTGDDSSNDP